MTGQREISVFAPAKINLYLHITGKNRNGYHNLDSLVCFADIGDVITLREAEHFSFTIIGPYANQLPKSTLLDKNLVTLAAQRLAAQVKKPLNLNITLTKNLPVAAGIGGGSADAAACIWALQQWWQLQKSPDYLPPLLNDLGADVPICMSSRTSRILGVGEKFEPVDINFEIPVVLVNPNKPCLTSEVFLHYQQKAKQEIKLPTKFEEYWSLINILKETENDLYNAACQQVFEIENIIGTLKTQNGCSIARMSGSGATCFALFESENFAVQAKEIIQNENPDWWVASGLLNTLHRY